MNYGHRFVNLRKYLCFQHFWKQRKFFCSSERTFAPKQMQNAPKNSCTNDFCFWLQRPMVLIPFISCTFDFRMLCKFYLPYPNDNRSYASNPLMRLPSEEHLFKTQKLFSVPRRWVTSITLPIILSIFSAWSRCFSGESSLEAILSRSLI